MSAATVSRKLHLTDDLGVTIGGMLAIVFSALAVFVAIAMAAIIAGSRAIGRPTCRNFAAQTGFPTKFVVLNVFDTGTCLAQAPNGRWVKNTQIVQFIQAGKP